MNTMQAAIDNYNVQMGTNLQLYIPSQIQETDWVKEISRKNSKTGAGLSAFPAEMKRLLFLLP